MLNNTESLFKNLDFDNNSLVSRMFWTTVSNKIFNSSLANLPKHKRKPLKDRCFNIRSNKILNKESVKVFLSKRRLKQCEKNGQNNLNTIGYYMNKRKTSIDKISERKKIDISKFVKKPDSIEEPKTSNEDVITIKIKKLSTHNDRQVVKELFKRNKSVKNFDKLKPIMLNKAMKQKTKEKLGLNKNLQNRSTKASDEDILNFLKLSLSSSIAESVYLKDFFKLFVNYQKKHNRKYHHRSKSADRHNCRMTKTKQNYLDKCLFSDFVGNLYMKYCIEKTKKHKNCFILGKEILFSNDVCKMLFKFERPEFQTQNEKRERFCFNFFNFNRYLKEFCLTIKKYNKTGQLSLKQLGSPVKAVKEKKSNKKVKQKNVRKEDPINELKVYQKPIKNQRSASIFQKMVHSTVVIEKEEEKKKRLNAQLALLLRKSVFNFHKKEDSSPKNEKHKSKLLTSHFKSFRVNRKKTNKIDVAKVYKLPKVSKIPNVKIAFNSTKNFNRQDRANFFSSTVKKKKKSPYRKVFKIGKLINNF